MKHLITIMFLCLLVTSGSIQGRDHDEETDHSKALKQSSKSYLDSTGIYVGEYKYGKRHGHGTTTYANGNKHIGEYKDGKKHGQGTWTHPDGSMYVGLYKDGKWHGQGTWIDFDGSKYVGEWKDHDEWQGIKYDKDGNVTATWLDGVRSE